MTSVRDLLDVAAAELDGLSCRITLGRPRTSGRHRGAFAAPFLAGQPAALNSNPKRPLHKSVKQTVTVTRPPTTAPPATWGRS